MTSTPARSGPLERAMVRDAPFDDRVVLGVAGGEARQRIAGLLAAREAREELAAERAAGGGRREDVQQALRRALLQARR
jgi:hypothetical protein